MAEPTSELELKSADESRGWLSRGVASVGLASFFSDSGHEIATAILPSFVTAVLRSTPGALGVIEGISDALTGVAKLIGGPLANDPRRRGEMARGGYLVTAAATGAIGLCGAVWQVGVLRATAWAARGIRSPARDSLLASLAPAAAYGRAFGLERAGDNMGAVAGPLLASALVAALGIRPAIYFAVIPASSRPSRSRWPLGRPARRAMGLRVAFASMRAACGEPASPARSCPSRCSSSATSPRPC